MSIEWFWEDDSKEFKRFEKNYEKYVETQFASAGKCGVVKVNYEGWKYELDFDAFTQKNLESGKVRNIKRVDPTPPPAPPVLTKPPQWEWVDDKGKFVPFSAAHSADLEATYSTLPPTVAPQLTTNFKGTAFGGYSYTFNFKEMTQTNDTTKKVRSIRRIANGHPVRDFKDVDSEPAVKKSKVEDAVPVVTSHVAVADTAKSYGDKSVGFTGGAGKTKLIKKGHGVVDPHSGMAESCHIYESGTTVYQCTLNQTNIGQNNNKFYVIQLLEDDKGGKFYVFTRWGRVGVVGQSALDHYTSVGPAIVQYKKKFREKTSNDWDHLDSFTKVPGKYQLMAIDLGGDDDGGAADSIGDQIGEKHVSPSTLTPAVQNLVKLIANTKEMTASMKELEIDTNKMPLGKISKKQIKDAFGYLKEIEFELKSPSPNHTTLLNATSMFYTLIPHDFGMCTPPVIKSIEMLKRKMELLDILGDLEIASKLLATATKTGVNPLDQAYHSLNCDLTALDHGSADFKRVVDYVANTHGKTHTAFRLTVMEVFAVRRTIEEARYKAYETLHNKQLLWHGSRTTNFMGILSQGLRIAPPEAPVTGYMFGKGIYFADVCSKSANYCNTTPSNNVGCLLLCEAALGTTKDLNAAMYMDKPQPGTHSTKGVGKMCPDDSGAQIVDGVKWPMGKMVDAPVVGHTSLLYPEYIVYDVAQCKMKYLVQLKFEYGKK